jgi:hypothetical protein
MAKGAATLDHSDRPEAAPVAAVLFTDEQFRVLFDAEWPLVTDASFRGEAVGCYQERRVRGALPVDAIRSDIF